VLQLDELMSLNGISLHLKFDPSFSGLAPY
jgi:hypothetical protein